jgi:thiol-disulfide isomerase/thioredoxin
MAAAAASAAAAAAPRRRRRSASAATLTLALACAALAVAHGGAGVVTVTDDSFDGLVADGAPWLISISAAWCGHCRALKPVWAALAESAAASGVRVGSVEGPDELMLQQRFGVSGYPSIYLIRGGAAWEFRGERSVAALLEFASAGYAAAPPLEGRASPLSASSRAAALLLLPPKLARRGFRWLQAALGLGDVAAVVAALLVPVAVAVAGIGAWDFLALRGDAARRAHAGGAARQHAD